MKNSIILWKHNSFTLLLSTVCIFVRGFFLQVHIKMDNFLGLFFQMDSVVSRISRKEHDLDKNKEDKLLALFQEQKKIEISEHLSSLNLG